MAVELGEVRVDIDEASLAAKGGARHSAHDMQLLGRLHQMARDITDLVAQLGFTDVGTTEVDESENPNADITPGSADVTGKADETVEETEIMDEIKAISLDEKCSMVREAFWKTFRSGDFASDEYSHCVCVYDDYIICKYGIHHYKVPYTISDKVNFTPKESWQKVESEWVAKAIPQDILDMEITTVKAVGEDRLGMYLVVWGDEDRRDLHGEYFTKGTQELTSIFEEVGKIPLLYHHAMNDEVKTEVVGLIDTMKEDDVGLWVEAELKKASRYREGIKKLTRQQALGSSSGTLPGARKVGKGGEIERWPIIEGSLTPSPVEFRQRTDLPVTVLKAYYESAGIPFPHTDEESPGAEDAQKAMSLELELERERLELYKTQLSVI